MLLKPAEQAPGCAAELVRALREAGVPPEALALLPGEGDVGAALVRDPRVHTIAFTGSSAVGLEIVRTAAEVVPGQRHLKRVIAEMGGKNCVIVDGDADLDEVVPALVKSAFNYAGQKCSAAARVLVHEAIHDGLVERLSGAVEVLEVGQAERLDIDVPAVIERDAQERVARYRGEAEQTGRIAASRRTRCRTRAGSRRRRWPSTSRPGRAVLEEEIFGPLLAVERVRDVEDACDRVDASSFGAHGRALRPQPGHRRLRRRPHAGRQPLREPGDHRRDGRAPAVRRQPALGHGDEGRRAGVPAPVRRAARGDREHHAPRARRLTQPPFEAGT